VDLGGVWAPKGMIWLEVKRLRLNLLQDGQEGTRSTSSWKVEPMVEQNMELNITVRWEGDESKGSIAKIGASKTTNGAWGSLREV